LTQHLNTNEQISNFDNTSVFGNPTSNLLSNKKFNTSEKKLPPYSSVTQGEPTLEFGTIADDDEVSRNTAALLSHSQAGTHKKRTSSQANSHLLITK
jgi:hypothetical protein